MTKRLFSLRRFANITCVSLTLLLQGCSHNFPRPGSSPASLDQQSGREIFGKTFAAHGGRRLSQLNDVNVGLEGDWKFLITRIQPLVTDHRYRVKSQERLLPNLGVYSSVYEGPAGTKKVIRSTKNTRVFYNSQESFEQDVLKSTALTADSFFIFLLGPLALERHAAKFIRLADIKEKGKTFHRIYAELVPGIGASERDEIVLWVDTSSMLTHRVHITLEGYKTTKNAHVDVTYLHYKTLESFVFPVAFHERVRGPISIDAHSWKLTGLDINRNLSFSDHNKTLWEPSISRVASPLE